MPCCSNCYPGTCPTPAQCSHPSPQPTVAQLQQEKAALRAASVALYKWLVKAPYMERCTKKFTIPDEVFEPFQDALFAEGNPLADPLHREDSPR